MCSVTIEMALECLVHNLRDGQTIEVCLAPDGLDPATLDMEGDALGLLGGIADLRGEVYPTPDLTRLANEQALRRNAALPLWLKSGSFPLAVAPVKHLVHLFSNVFITKMGIVRNDCVEAVIQHNSRFEVITGIAYPFGCPHRTHDMRMPVLAGIAVDDL